MHANVEYLNWSETEALRNFQLWDMRYDDKNVVTERVSTTVLQLYLIWTPSQILEHVIETDLRLPLLLRLFNGWGLTLVDGRGLQTSNTIKTFNLDVTNPVKWLLGLIKNIKIDLWIKLNYDLNKIDLWPDLNFLANLIINKKYQLFW